jgi:uncharacterized NAD-dependent epimerase/dehydratase family protein
MTRLRKPEAVAVPPINEFIQLNEELATVCGSLTTAITVGVALNTSKLDHEAALSEIAKLEDETGLPVEDVVRFGAAKLGQAVLDS